MKLKISFPLVFISTNVIFVFFIIFRQSWMTQLSYQQQRLEKELSNLKQKKDELDQELYELQDPAKIKEWASKNKMSKIKIAQVKKL